MLEMEVECRQGYQGMDNQQGASPYQMVRMLLHITITIFTAPQNLVFQSHNIECYIVSFSFYAIF